MNRTPKVTVVTGGASGIGKALCFKFAEIGATKVVVVDLDARLCQLVVDQLPSGVGYALSADCSSEQDILRVITTVETELGPIDVFIGNAGISGKGGIETSNEKWERVMGINFYQAVYIARHMIPKMAKRGGGTLVFTGSAAGLLSEFHAASYAVSKHAIVAFSEWLSITHAGDGINVHCLCPQAVDTPMIGDAKPGSHVAAVDGIVPPEHVANELVKAMHEGTFLVLPHPRVKEYMKRRATDHDRWLTGMRRLQARL